MRSICHPARPRAARAMLGLLLAGTAVSTARALDAPRVNTEAGAVTGTVYHGVYAYLGIPYAKPPVGDLRWRPPVKAAPWSGTYKADTFGATCAQITELGVFAGPANNNEDCLSLNVFTTGPGAGKNKRAPVMMWIHGGGLVDGESSDYDGSKLAKGGPGGPTVVVTINYRLGLLGYLANPALDAEGHNFGNYGLMDQQLALHWIRDNIAAFGGDPSNVTVGGQSAGSTSTGANVISPLSKGLFNRAIFESGSLLTVAPLSFAEQNGTNFAAAAGCPTDGAADEAACLRAMAVPAIMNLQGTLAANGPYVTGLIVDGTVLPYPGDQAFATGNFNHMPIMAGYAHDEGGFTVSINEYFYGVLTEADYEAKIQAAFGGAAAPGGPNYPPGTANQVLAQYPASNYPNPSEAWINESSDVSACRGRHLNHILEGQVPLYTYEFEDKTAPWYFPPLSFAHKAAHTIDIQFLFPLWHGGPLGIEHPLSPAEEGLSRELVNDWTNLAWSGDPNLVGQHPWPKYTKHDEVYLSEQTGKLSTFTDAQYATDHNCAFWDTVLVY